MPTVEDTDTTARPTSSEMRAPGQQSRQDVAPELVEPERMRQARWLEPPRQLLPGRVVRRDRRTHERRHDRHETR